MGTINRSILLAILTFGTAAALSADSVCDYKLRPPNPAEKKAYADAFASFQQIAPPAPAGWESTDSAKDNVFPANDVCAAPGQILTSFTFSRSYNRTEGMAERNAEVMRMTTASMQKSQDRQKSNEARLSDIRKQEEDLAKQMAALAEANKLTEIAPLTVQIKKLQEEEKKLMGVEESDAESIKIEAAARKDTYAQFVLTVDGNTNFSDAFKPMSVSSGKGFRQDYVDDNGIAHSDIMIILKHPAGARPTVVSISADHDRADSLLNAAKLQ